ncbi:hypothetical protein D3C84_516110 [compost metagenome]
MFPASAQMWGQLDSVVQRVELRHAQTEGTVDVVPCLSQDFQGRVPTFFRVVVALIALIAEAGERLDGIDVATHVVTHFRKGLLRIGVVLTFGVVAESVEGYSTFGAAIVAAMGEPHTKRHRSIPAQCIGPQMPAIEATIECAAIQACVGFAADHTQAPFLINSPISAHYQTLGGML